MQLEIKQLSEAEFDQREKDLLDRLDEIEKGAAEAAISSGGAEVLEDDEEAEADVQEALDDEEFEFEIDEVEDEDEE